MGQARIGQRVFVLGYEARAPEFLDQSQGDPVAELPPQLLGCHADWASFPKRLVM